MASHLQQFFTGYPGFNYDASIPANILFRQLRQHMGWADNSPGLEQARTGFRAALVLEFNAGYGTDITDINAWHSLCTVLRVDPLPDSVSQCRKIVKRIHVNIFDLVDVRSGALPVAQLRLFQTQRQLRKYTKRRNKIFPKGDAKAGGILKYLLREIR